jgi:parallel beta-helix repeat protein
MTIYYVHKGATGNDDGTSWEDAFVDLEAAVASRSGGDAVWCKTGTYYLSAPLSIPENVSVYGGFDFWLTGTDGSTSDRPWNTYLNGGDSVQGVLMQDGALIDGFVVEDCAAVDGAGIGVVGGDAGYYYGPELITDGDMAAAGTAAWSESANATLSKDTADPIVGQYLVVTVDNGYPNSANAYQTVMTIGNRYEGTGYLKGQGGKASLYDGAVELASQEGPWAFKGTGTFTAISTTFILKSTAGEADYNYFDQISLKEVLAYEGTISVTIRNCWVRNCHASDNGGGIYVSNGATVVIDNCTIHNCTADGDGGGISFLEECTAISVTDCEIYSCTAGDYGGGISVRGNDADNDYTFLRCRIHDNEAGLHGGGVYVADNADSDMRLTRCVLADNAATLGDLYLVTGVVTVTGCTINNGDVYAIQRVGGTMTVVNSIVWGTATPTNGTMTITYSDVQGGYTGAGNVNADPHFVGEGFHPYAIGAVSDAVDAANSGATYYTSTDLLGADMYDHPGKADTGVGATEYVDMGAYEFHGVPDNVANMAYYYLNLSGVLESISDTFWMHTILRLPEMPRVFGGNITSPVNVRHRISAEIEVDEADSELREHVYIDSGIASFREYDGTPIPAPSRAADYSEDFQSDDDPHVAEDLRNREGDASSKLREQAGVNSREYFRHVVVSMEWLPLSDGTSDVIRIYNVDFEQIHNEAYGYSHAAVEAHAGNTIFLPDVPLSSYHMRILLQETLLKMLYEAVTKMSVPVFGQFYQPVV